MQYLCFRSFFDANCIIPSCYTVLITAYSLACHRHQTSSAVNYLIICNTVVSVFHVSLRSVNGSEVKLIRTKALVTPYGITLCESKCLRSSVFMCLL